LNHLPGGPYARCDPEGRGGRDRGEQAVEEAKIEADRIIAEARKKAQAIAVQAHQEAAAEADHIVAAAVAEAEKEKEERLARAAARIEREVGIDESRRKRVVEGIVRCVCRP
jgi:vacuolar-type H+-ATPase subunit H